MNHLNHLQQSAKLQLPDEVGDLTAPRREGRKTSVTNSPGGREDMSSSRRLVLRLSELNVMLNRSIISMLNW